MNKQEILSYLDAISAELDTCANTLWEFAEPSGLEEKSAAYLQKILEEKGFRLHSCENSGYAFYAEYGSGSPVIALLAEYDALPDLSQAVGVTRDAGPKLAPGHGCGHNLLGVGCLGAALAMKQYLDETGVSGTIRFYGCPEEETLAGKVKMVYNHAFDGCDLALAWHPMNANTPINGGFLAMNSLKFRFHGLSSHAGQAPEAGRSALDAVELMNVGANYLREHVIDSARIHYTITNAGGAPNVIPPEAESWYFVRAPRRKDVTEITERLCRIAQGAALMTDTTTDYELQSGTYEILGNNMLRDLTHANMMEIPIPQYSEEERRFAKEIQQSFDPEVVEKERVKFHAGEDSIFHEGVLPLPLSETVKMTGSSDVGDVSWNMPMAMFLTATWPFGVPPHSWQATSVSGSSFGRKGMLYASKVFAGMMVDLFTNPQLVEDAKAEFEQRTATQKYQSPLNA